MQWLLYGALAVILHLEVPSFPMVLLPFICPAEELLLYNSEPEG